jgi:L-rhamnose mutarotase
LNNQLLQGGGYVNPHYDFPTKIYCQTLQLADNPALLESYRKVHDEIWDEIPEGICAVGILEMKLFLFATTGILKWQNLQYFRASKSGKTTCRKFSNVLPDALQMRSGK